MKRKKEPSSQGGAGDRSGMFRSIDSTLQELESPDQDQDEPLLKKVRDLERRNAMIQSLLHITVSISSTLNFQEVLKKIVDAVVSITDCSRGFLMLYDDDGKLNFTIARNRDQAELQEKDFKISQSIIQKVAESGIPAFLSNVREVQNLKDSQSIIDLNINTAICIPLIHDGRLGGVIYADSEHISATFSESDLSIMKAFGEQAVIALENAKRHGELILSKKSLENQNLNLKKKLSERYEFSGMVGRSKEMRSVFDTISKVAPLSTTILIQGETGTGKELIAKAIHHNSPRKDRPMLSVNCGALPRDLLESELFGYRRGAFTGADQDRTGLFEAASGGTVFLDEIGEMAVELQVKLLRTLQEGEIRRLGDERARSIDVRMISATNKDLAMEVERGTFRRDLFYRLNVVPIRIPPLRERREDVLPLADFFMEKYALIMGVRKPGLTRPAKELLLGHAWVGNVRELEHAIERALALGEGGDMVDVDQFQQILSGNAGASAEAEDGTSLKERLMSLEKDYINVMLIRNGWNVSKTASVLKISRQQLYIKIKRFGLAAEGR
jgi:transcriptional regulator with GAF, ATPase, and Fis domain